MKKFLSLFSVLLLGLILVACNGEVDPAQAKLDSAYDSVVMLFDGKDETAADFSLPTTLAGGVKVAWTSSEPGAAAIGQPDASGMVTVSINRAPGATTDVTITATLTIKAENSDDILTKSREIPITILASNELDVPRDTIAEILAIDHPDSDPADKADKLDVKLSNVTIFAMGESSVVFGYDGTGIIQFYGGTNDWEVGKVYEITGLLEWYFGIWEVVDPNGTLQPDATPQFPTKEEVTDIDQLLVDLKATGAIDKAHGSVVDGNFEPVYASVTGTVFATGTGNYDFFLMDSSFDKANPGVPGATGAPAEGLMFYYGTNDFAALKAMDGFEVTIDVVIHTYRSNNHAFAVYYVGGKDGIVLGELSDEQSVDLDLAQLNLPFEVLETKEKALNFAAEGVNGSTITWGLLSAHEANVDLATGNVTIPATGEVEVKLKATITKNDVEKTKEFTVVVGAPQTYTILAARDVAKNRTFTITGVVTGYNGNNAVTIEDATAAIVLYGSKIGAKDLEGVKVGDQITVTGKKDVYNGLHQVKGGFTVTDIVDGTTPAFADLDALAKLDNESLDLLQSRRVLLTNVKVTAASSDDYGNVELTFERLDGETITFRWDSRVAFDGSEALADIKVGDIVDIEGAPLTWFNGPQLSADAKDQLEVVPATDAWLVKNAAEDLTLENTAFTEDGTLVLPETSGDIAIEWELQNPLDAAFIDLATGNVTVGEAFVEVVLVATFTKGDVTVTQEFTIAVGVAVELAVFEHYKFDVGVYPGSGTGYQAEEAFTWTESFGDVTVSKDRVQINKSTFAPHDGEAMLVLSLRSTYNREAHIIFDFTGEGYADLKQISFEANVWNNNHFQKVVNVANGALNLQVKVGDDWVNVETTAGDENVLQQLEFEKYVEFTFAVEGPGLYRIVYSGDSTETGNTTTAATVDNLKLYK